jgi:3-hydroxy-3-methylglutaryl CoA synthase
MKTDEEMAEKIAKEWISSLKAYEEGLKNRKPIRLTEEWQKKLEAKEAAWWEKMKEKMREEGVE